MSIFCIHCAVETYCQSLCICGRSMSFSETDQSVSNSLDTISNPSDIQDSELVFGDSACGEPLLTQRISLDFTPNELDNDFVQRKCCAFWDYINSRPELKNLKTIPDPEVYSNESVTSVTQSNLLPREPTSSPNITKTAVNMLEFVEEKGLINRIFEAKLPKLYCEINRETSSNESMTGISKADPLENKKDLKQKKQKRQTDMKSLPKLRVMCNKMHEWDNNHPKSMDPPGPPPALPEDIKLIRY